MLTPVAGAGADDYPSRPVRIVVPYPAGGTQRRRHASAGRAAVTPAWPEHRHRESLGGAGQIGVEAAVQADRDGYTLVVGGLATQVLIPTIKTTRYDPAHDFIPLGQISSAPQILTLRSSLGLKTMAEVIAHAKAYPGKFTVGSAGVGTNTHLAILLWAREAGIEVTHVPYRSTTLWVNDAVGNQIDSGFGEPKSLAGQIEAGTLVPIAVASSSASRNCRTYRPWRSRPARRADRELVWIMALAAPARTSNVSRRQSARRRTIQATWRCSHATTPARVPGADSFAEVIRGDTARLTPLIHSLRDKLR